MAASQEDPHSRRDSRAMTLSAPGSIPGSKQLAQTIDHTMLKAHATEAQIDMFCDEAKRFNFRAVCVRLRWVELAASILEGSPVQVACVIGFHEGTYSTQEKAEEAAKAVAAGASELDMVINWPLLKEKRFSEVLEDVAAVRKIASGNVKLKVILETSQLVRSDIISACLIARLANADFVKTSTGFCGQGATVENVRLMKNEIGDRMKVKASGGVRTAKDCLAMLEAGAERIGTSNGVAIMQEANLVDRIGSKEAEGEKCRHSNNICIIDNLCRSNKWLLSQSQCRA
ncbi:MAG: hypothetical protein Q9217_005438 [Psora testacea]